MHAPATSVYRIAFAAMVAMTAAMGIGRFIYTPILPGMMEALGLSASDAGLIASANYLGYLAGAVLAGGGWAEGRERRIVLAALAANAVLMAAMGLTTSLAAFVAIRFLGGLASAFVMVFLAAIVFPRLAQAGRSDLQAMHFGGVGLGIAVSALVTGGGYLVDAAWQQNWYWSGALSLAGLFAVWFAVDPGRPVASAPQAEPPLPKDPALRRVVLAYGLFGFGYIVTATFLVAIVRSGTAGHAFEAVVWLAAGLAGVPSVWLWSKSVRRIGLTATFAVACLVEAVGVVASVSLGGHVGPLIGGVVLGGTFIAITALGLQAGRQLAGQAPRRVFALMTASFGTGQILGPIAAGYVADLTGDYVVPSLGAAAALLLAAIVARNAGRLAS